jgi:hypothetical protein
MLKINFPLNVKLEIKVKDKYYKTTPNVFRSWHGARKVEGKPFIGDVYCFLSNSLYRDGIQKQTVAARPKKIKVVPIAIRVITLSSKGAGVLPTSKSGRPIKFKK